MIKSTFSKLKILAITLCFVLLINLFVSEPAYSRGGGGGGCFAEGTLILTPEGNQNIEQLHSGDHVVNYNFSTHHRERGVISNIEIINSPDYYLINHQTKVTGTHPFYLRTPKGIKVTQTQYLQQGDNLINQNNSWVKINSIEHIFESISVYNLISINPNHNFYADGFLVHNKGGGGGGGSYGRGGSGEYAVTQKNFLGFIQALIILISGLSCILFWQQIYNLIIYTDKKFTDDQGLIEFTQDINPDFSNKYSMWYCRDDQLWQQVPSAIEVSESEYQHFISKAELIEKARTLFLQYQRDWTYKEFSVMKQYILEPFYTTQKEIFHRNYGNNFDIVYDCRLSLIIPLDIELQADKYFFRLQINGEMINFKLSPKGYILSGKSEPRSFSEYWDLKLMPDKQCYLVNISQATAFCTTI